MAVCVFCFFFKFSGLVSFKVSDLGTRSRFFLKSLRPLCQSCTRRNSKCCRWGQSRAEGHLVLGGPDNSSVGFIQRARSGSTLVWLSVRLSVQQQYVFRVSHSRESQGLVASVRFGRRSVFSRATRLARIRSRALEIYVTQTFSLNPLSTLDGTFNDRAGPRSC